jgi:hypothetical protein
LIWPRIEQEADRIADDRAADRDPLLFAFGQLAGQPVEKILELEHARDLGDPARDLGTADPLRVQRILQVLTHAQARVQRVELKGHGDVALARGELVDPATGQPDLAVGRGLQAGDHAQGGGLAAPGGTEQAHHFPRIDRQIDGIDRDQLIEPLGGLLELDVGHRLKLRARRVDRPPGSPQEILEDVAEHGQEQNNERRHEPAHLAIETLRDLALERIEAAGHLAFECIEPAGHLAFESLETAGHLAFEVVEPAGDLAFEVVETVAHLVSKCIKTLGDPGIEALELLMHLHPQLLDLAGHYHLHVLFGRDRTVDFVGQVLGERLRQFRLDAVLNEIAREACRVHPGIRLKRPPTLQPGIIYSISRQRRD